MVKTYYKSFGSMFKRHITRLVSVFLMVLVSVGFTSGIGMATDKIRHSVYDEYIARNVSDFIVKSTRQTGFTEEELSLLSARYGEENFLQGASLEFKEGAMITRTSQDTSLFPEPVEIETDMQFSGMGEGVSRVYFFSGQGTEENLLKQNSIRVIEESEGELPEGTSPITVERGTAQLIGYHLGDTLEATVTMRLSEAYGNMPIQQTTYIFTVARIVENPLHMAERWDKSMRFFDEEGEPLELESVFYLFDPSEAPPAGDVYLTVPALRGNMLFSGGYDDAMEREKAEIEALLGEESVVLSLHENYSFESFMAYAEKVDAIGYVLTVVFLLVTLLVVLNTMTRLLEEERGQIACLKTLGYSSFQIVSKYLLFALVGTAIGCAMAYFAGLGLAYIIYINFTWNYSLPPYSSHVALLYFILSASLVLAATLAATAIAGFRLTHESPAALLRPKAPKAGKKVILERIPLLWNRLSFKYKSTVRNVLRFKIRFAMTVVAVLASTALVFAGLAVLDCCLFQDIGTTAMIGVAAIVLLFAALLNAVVIYTLTNINISERNRELATLMVLGYQDGEVTGYIFREIYITSSIGILLGIPGGTLLCLLVFSLLGFGSVGSISWFVWLLAPLLSLLFTFLVTLMLRSKIVKIDMNESLKAVE